MIKSLLDDEEEKEEEERTGSRFFRRGRDREGILSIDLASQTEDEPQRSGESEAEIKDAIRSEQPPSPDVDIPEQRGDLQFKALAQEPEDQERSRHEQRASELEQMLLEIEHELARERESLKKAAKTAGPPAGQRQESGSASAKDRPLYRDAPTAASEAAGVGASSDAPVITVPFEPESKIDSLRKSGLAWSAAIALFGSVVFMLVLGWFADLLIGSSPWGKVAGIVIGSLIGFVQFFRITSQINKPGKSDFDKVSLKSSEPAGNDENPDSLTG